MIASCFPTSSSCWANLQSHSFILGESGGESLWTWYLCTTVDERCSELTWECLIFNPGNDCSFIHNYINNHFKRVYVIGSSAGMTRHRTEYMTADGGYSSEETHWLHKSRAGDNSDPRSVTLFSVDACTHCYGLEDYMNIIYYVRQFPVSCNVVLLFCCVNCVSVCFAEQVEWWLSV